MLDVTARTATLGAFGHGLKQITAACLLSGLIAGVFSMLTSEGAADTAPATAISVNRLNKADRLPSSPGIQLLRHDSSFPAPELRALGPIPIGCELAFSTLVELAHANIIRGCLS
jgi:hypothetical protein